MDDALSVHFTQPGFSFNQYIATIYKDGNDNIGLHRDKMPDIYDPSWIMVLKLGASRHFHITMDDGAEWNEIVEGGDAIFMTTEANKVCKHGVPVDDGVGLSGSIVGRNIKTLFSQKEIEDKITDSREGKVGRKNKEANQAKALKKRRDTIATKKANEDVFMKSDDPDILPVEDSEDPNPKRRKTESGSDTPVNNSDGEAMET